MNLEISKIIKILLMDCKISKARKKKDFKCVKMAVLGIVSS